MPEVSLDVAGRSYRLGCGEGEEEHLVKLGAVLDADARGLLRQFGQMSEGRLLMMTALMVADRLADAEEKANQSEQRLKQAQKLAESRARPDDIFSPEREKALAGRINALVAQIEGIDGLNGAAGG